MKLLNFQLAIFVEETIERPDKTYNSINEACNELYDSIPQILNIPADAPAEIPRVQGRNSDNTKTINVSVNRIDAHWNFNFESQTSLLDSIKNVSQEVENVIKAVTESHRVVREGLVYTGFEENTESVKAINERYLSSKYKPSITELAIRQNEVIQNKGFSINNIRTIESSVLSNNIKTYTGVTVQWDINNVPEKRSLTAAELIFLFEQSLERVNGDIDRGVI